MDDDAYFGVPEDEWLMPADTFKVKQGRHFNCGHCGFYGRCEIGRQPRPSNRKAAFCPSCRGAAEVPDSDHG